ncbi:rod shape-determining protein RodA [soil metagenome]|nr:rod shape-determining protein RodA [Trueperaceae bacterium]
MSRLEPYLPILVVLLALIGFVTLSSAVTEGQDLTRQAIYFVVGAVGCVAMFWVGGARLDRLSIPLYAVTLVLLVVVLVFGEEINGAKRWLQLGPVRMQPSELAKVAIIMVLGRFLSAPPSRGLLGYLGAGAIVGVPFVLVLLGPDLGSALVIAAIGAGMLFVRGIPTRLVIAAIVLVVVGVPLAVPLLEPHQQARVTAFLDPDADPQGAGYQVVQARIAIGSGGLTGKGYKQGTQTQFDFIPFKHTDFIFPVLAEEMGFVGSMFMLGVFALLFWRLAVMAMECPRPRDQLVIAGILSYLGFQTLVNIGVALGLAPVTGLTLPIVSYGGTNLIVTLGVLGLAMLVHRDRYRGFT